MFFPKTALEVAVLTALIRRWERGNQLEKFCGCED
jgi:hypothetical protein